MQNSRRQVGSVLIVGIIFLLVMTMLGITAMQTTSQEERMAGNMRDRGVAFQAAEIALRAGEKVVFSGPPSSGTGFYDITIDKGAPDETVESNWTNGAWNWTSGLPIVGSTTQTNSAYPLLAEEPKFWIEARLGRPPLEAGQPREIVYFVTARSTGASGGAPVVLQSTARY
ncbi:pilus assembly PilX family protein [Denitromonas iodatirespirans]|uniref:Pilus assembly protein PilX n=1 Tax=Denitromonas iodatirespirans TaxID=2795389 RepID=A0A944HFT5_DENI1|nr:PilX N-terminal domain-containing pilus assembly protein [Denitromonas iodatirespirans]MBT0964001.1 hypothetical protein [Denitromonas iodatirespirans]